MLSTPGLAQAGARDEAEGCAHVQQLFAADRGLPASLPKAGLLMAADRGCTSVVPRLCGSLALKRASYAAISGATPRYTPFAAYACEIVADPSFTNSGDGRLSGQSTGCAVAQLPPLRVPVRSGSDWGSVGGGTYAGTGNGSGRSTFTSQDPDPYTRTSVTSALRMPDRSTGVAFAVEVHVRPYTGGPSPASVLAYA